MKIRTFRFFLTAAILSLLVFPFSLQAKAEKKQKPKNSSAKSSLPPQAGPYVHQVYTASSKDGLNWALDSAKPIAEHASVPAALVFPDGVMRVYFVDASQGPERLGCRESRDNGKTFSAVKCTIEGMTSERAVDFSPVMLADGRARLYYYAVNGYVDSTGVHSVDSAASEDGVHFVHEASVFQYDGLVDPDVFWNGSEWVMHVFSLAAHGTVVASSEDGLQFQYKGLLSPRGYGVTKPLAIPGGRFRMYGFKQPNADFFTSFISDDGYEWKLEKENVFQIPAGMSATDPFVVALAGGGYKMVFKGESEKTAPRRPPGGKNAAGSPDSVS